MNFALISLATPLFAGLLLLLCGRTIKTRTTGFVAIASTLASLIAAWFALLHVATVETEILLNIGGWETGLADFEMKHILTVRFALCRRAHDFHYQEWRYIAPFGQFKRHWIYLAVAARPLPRQSVRISQSS